MSEEDPGWGYPSTEKLRSLKEFNHFLPYGATIYIGRKLIGPASIRQKNSNFPMGSTVSEVNKYIKAKKLHNPNPPPLLDPKILILFPKGRLTAEPMKNGW